MSKRTNNGKLKSLKDKHDKKVSEIEELEKNIVNQVFDNYIDPEVQKELLSDAKTFHYSETKYQMSKRYLKILIRTPSNIMLLLIL